MFRPDFQETFMRIAVELSKRSTCQRLQVGSVIVSNDYRRIIGIGYNGSASGTEHKCDPNKEGNCGDNVHAEINSIINKVESSEGSIVFVTHAPCHICACALINAGIDYLYYLNEYRDKQGLYELESAGIATSKIDLI